jgi:hypothetical protein
MRMYGRSDRGVALPTVIMVMLVVFTFASLVLSLATSQTKAQVSYENGVGALNAAEAGLNKYLCNLNKETPAVISMDPTVYPNESNPKYVYQLQEMDVSKSSQRIVKCTGWVYGRDSVKRSITVTFVKRSFTKFAYFSDSETCDVYENGKKKHVEEIYWKTGENCFGSYRTNGNLCIEGSPVFWGKVEYSGKIVPGKGYNPVFKRGVSKEPQELLPSSNSELKTVAKWQEMNTGQKHYFNGRTSIMFLNNGKMNIWSKDHDKDVRLYNVGVPNNGVIYVDGASDDGLSMFSNSLGNVFISGRLKGRVTVAAAHNIYVTDCDPTIENFGAVAYQTNGLTYTNTQFQVNLDSSSPGYGTVTQNPPGDDMLGLIANQDVCTLTQGWFDNPNAISAWGDLYIYAAIMAIHGSLCNPNYKTSPNPMGRLIIRGSIAQNTRGIVSQPPGGYIKDYAHDPRMAYYSPPNYLEPAKSGWEIGEWKEER